MSMPAGYIETFSTLDARLFIIAIRRLADSLAYGTDRSPFLGSGIEYVQSRPYADGDSVRSMDWKVTARTGRYHVKEYEAPKSMPCWLVVDTSASMATSSTPRSKYENALFIAGGLALAALDRISPVAILGVGERQLRSQPSLSKGTILKSLLDLRHFRYDENTELGRKLTELAPSLGQRSLLVVLSDLHEEGSVAILKRLAHQHDVVVLQLRDPAEDGFRGSGFVFAREPETGRTFVTRGRQVFGNPEQVRSELRRAGIDHLVVRTDLPFAHAIRHLFKNRAAVGRGAR